MVSSILIQYKNFSDRPIRPIDGTLTGTTTECCLVSYTLFQFGEECYPSAEDVAGVF